MTKRLQHLSMMQGAAAARTEPYISYGEGVLQAATQQHAKSSGRASSSARSQDGAVRESRKALTLSVIIPAYNEENHLRACLDTIATQSVVPDEVIVVDNNSTDATAKVAKSYPFVRLLSEKRQGVVYARNKGFDAAKSEIIGRIDADSLLPSDWVERIKGYYSVASGSDRAITGGAYFYNVRFGQLMGWWQGQVAFRLNRFLLGHYILYGSNMAIPKRLWAEVRSKVCDDLDVHEDLDLAIHLHRLGYKITYNETLRVGVYMRRVFSDRKELWPNLLWWPRTLQRHGLWTWVMGWLGAVLLYLLSLLFFIAKKR